MITIFQNPPLKKRSASVLRFFRGVRVMFSSLCRGVFGAREIEEGALFGKGRSGIVKEQHPVYFSIAVGGLVLAVVWSTGSINCRLAIFHTELHEQRYTPFLEKNAPKGVFCQRYNQSFCLSLHRTTVGRVGNSRLSTCAKSVLRGKNGDGAGGFTPFTS